MKRIITFIIGLTAVAISLGLWVLTPNFGADIEPEFLQIWVSFLRLLFAIGIGFGLGLKAMKWCVGEASSND